MHLGSRAGAVETRDPSLRLKNGYVQDDNIGNKLNRTTIELVTIRHCRKWVEKNCHTTFSVP